ncbi:efflux RND transporter periplasmic adaptor subunit [Pseudoduganella sp. FT25W]|uniref:Efflux RND transporter periplasmic adaptor subunit n=2 Tax=Duganella alba TaxID=2666081 RepID=A0A6L5QDS4_9BURK|nr:efflux RND transporter periplasmic adaptor subunit [Duganella alba]MRX07432.1 efflux RND transporter periplasmic adaptor subunit [Duganella alba]MRX15817.1 efflux RND transporter periplasmic adaptor subunit [Duganella alba]
MLRTAGAVAVVSALAVLAGCSKSASEAPHQQQVAEVGVFKVAQAPLQITTELPGRTAAYQVAEVRPQVSGLIQKRLFVEGADVKAGMPLYQIDPATYQASYNSAKAALSKAKANLLTAAPKVQRYKELVAIEGVSKQDYDDAVAAHEQAKADVESAAAALEQAKINVGYTHVDAPISGRIGRSSVTPGALVTASQTNALTTVQQLDPIYVDVTQTSEDMLRLKREVESGGLKKDGSQAKVTLVLSDGTKYAIAGKLQFSDVTVDPGTGNVTLRALFPNPKHDLLPGMFVRAMIESGVDEHAIAVPQQGVTRNAKGEATALVLNKEGKVEQRTLVTGATLGDKWLVKSGLNDGDLLIVEGLQKVKPGAPANAAKPAAAPAAVAVGGAVPANAKSAQ